MVDFVYFTKVYTFLMATLRSFSPKVFRLTRAFYKPCSIPEHKLTLPPSQSSGLHDSADGFWWWERTSGGGGAVALRRRVLSEMWAHLNRQNTGVALISVEDGIMFEPLVWCHTVWNEGAEYRLWNRGNAAHRTKLVCDWFFRSSIRSLGATSCLHLIMSRQPNTTASQYRTLTPCSRILL
jgi:hypothetical protein